MQILKYIIPAILLALPGTLKSQDKWSLEKCIAYAQEHNLQVKMQELNAENSGNAYLRSKMSFLPAINGNASQGYSFGRSVDAFTNEFAEENVRSNSFALTGSWTLFNGFQTVNSLQQSHYNQEAGKMDVEKMRNDISLNVASAYLNVLFMDELLYVADNQVEITKQQVDRSKKLFEAGTIAQGNYLEMQAQLASDEMQQVSAENNLTMAYLVLVQFLDLDSAGSFEIEKPVLNDPGLELGVIQPDDIFLEAEKNLPQIKSAEYRFLSSEKGLAAARGMRSPRLSLNGSFSSGYSSARQSIAGVSFGTPVVSGFWTDGSNLYDVYSYNYNYDYATPSFNDQIRDNVSKSLTFSLSIPIFNNWQANYSISSAKINALNSKYTLDLAKKQLKKEIQQAHADALAALNKFIAARKAVAAMEESFRYVQQKFDVGMVNSVDYNLSRNNLVKARSELIRSKYEYVFKLKILDFYMGQPIKL